MTTDKKSILEALLFVSPDPLSIKQIMSVIEGVNEQDIDGLISDLSGEYEARKGGLQIVKVADGFQMLTRLDCSPWLRKLEVIKVSNKLTQPALETLAIVAYKQPIIKAEIDAIRGVSSDGVLKTLLDRNLVKILGRKEMPGRPLLYGTTPEFLRYFGLTSISELPTLRDIEEIDGVPAPAMPSLDDLKALDSGTAEGVSAEPPSPESSTEKVPREFSAEESEAVELRRADSISVASEDSSANEVSASPGSSMRSEAGSESAPPDEDAETASS